jgi:hypothetical protein
LLLKIVLYIIYTNKKIKMDSKKSPSGFYKVAIVFGILAFIFEYTVLLRLYKRSPKLETISLVVAPLMAVAAVLISDRVFGYVSPVTIFAIAAAIELPLSLIGYEIQPDASVPTRVVVAASAMTGLYLAAEGILTWVN